MVLGLLDRRSPGAANALMAQAQNSATLDREEVARFAKDAGQWWDANGPFKPLHRITPLRLTYIREQLCRRFNRDKTQGQTLAGLSVLDIGCGGGLVAEPLARLGATVTGIDPGEANILAASAHAQGMGTRHRLSHRHG